MVNKILLVIGSLTFSCSAGAQLKKDSTADLSSYFKPVKWRCIGPFRGGRSVCATGVIGNNSTYYMGTTC